MARGPAIQPAFHFSPMRREPLNFVRLGLALDWARISRRAKRLVSLHLAQASEEARCELLSATGFELRRHFEDAALFEEIRNLSRRKARELKRAARSNGQRVKGSIVLACTPEGQHLQRIIDDLDRRISAREAALLCG